MPQGSLAAGTSYPAWGIYARLAGDKWLYQASKANYVSEYQWEVPGQTLTRVDRQLGKPNVIIKATYRLDEASGTIEREENGRVYHDRFEDYGSVSSTGTGMLGMQMRLWFANADHLRSISTVTMPNRKTYTFDVVQVRITGVDETALASQLDREKPSGPFAWLKFLNRAVKAYNQAMETFDVLNDPTGNSYNEFMARKVPELAPLLKGLSSGNPVTGTSGTPATGSPGPATPGLGAVAPNSYPPRANVLAGSAACAGYTVDNYKEYFDAHSHGPDVQLHTMCAHAYNYYWMYLNAIRQGYKQADSDITWREHEKAARVALEFWQHARVP